MDMDALGHQGSSLGMLLLFGANLALLGVLELALRAFPALGDAKPQVVEDPEDQQQLLKSKAPLAPAKKLSLPLAATLPSVRALCWELARLGAVVGFSWLCEYHPIFPHSQKYWERDQYYFLCLLLFIFCIRDIRYIKKNDVLNREQSEEWKGWMQFMFLLYHYYKAEEVYNSIRVMITCYVWMTGFGNFSFFYIKQDFSSVRVVQMLWRLNFLVVILCLVMGNTYILYYICPLHTFFFLMVYVAMGIGKSVNHTKWGIRWKLLALAVVILAVWDVPRYCLFRYTFGFGLGSDPSIGATSGTLWEWYFRTSLDHWSTFLGMIFALNFPMMTLWFKKVESAPENTRLLIKGAAGAAVLAVGIWWTAVFLPLPKLDYNMTNAYFAFVPLLVYVFLRNLTPGLRSYYLGPLHSIGKTTLETYLMQHHIWLTSNAKTLVTILPGYPKINFLLVSCVFIVLSQELYRLTMSLRGMLLPDSFAACARNSLGVALVLGVCWGLGVVLTMAGLNGPWVIGTVIIGLALAALMALRWLLLAQPPAHHNPAHLAAAVSVHPRRIVIVFGVLLVAMNTLSAYVSVFTAERYMPAVLLPPPPHHGSGTSPSPGQLSQPSTTVNCVADVNLGSWRSFPCREAPGAILATPCEASSWVWDGPSAHVCGHERLTSAEVLDLVGSKHVLLAGDSIQRYLYYSMARAVGDTAAHGHNGSAPRHSDISCSLPAGGSLRFLWSPFAKNITSRLDTLQARSSSLPEVVILGAGLWDALHHRDAQDYARQLHALASVLDSIRRKGTHVLWVANTRVVDERLNTVDKQTFMHESIVERYRNAALGPSGLQDHVDGVADGYIVTKDRELHSVDGVHYDDNVYDTMAQILLNQVKDLTKPAAGSSAKSAPAPAPAHELCSMCQPKRVLWLVCVIVLLIFSMDNFFGLPTLITRVLGGADLVGELTWEKAYGPLHQSLGIVPAATRASTVATATEPPSM
uniref:Cas1p 10 TM acyl transferase domain-containing protein n=1 Tax=Rhizochromulina marina TaxID=1034831 RepID=A0A7S2WUZ9_9STRA